MFVRLLFWPGLQREDPLEGSALLTIGPLLVQVIAAAGAVPVFVRLLESKNDLVAEGASEAMLHIVTPSQQQEGAPAQTASHAALRAAGAIPMLLSLVRQVSTL